MNKKTNKKLKKLSKGSSKSLLKEIEYNVINQKWLDYSSQIAIRALSIIEDKPDELTQKKLAKSLKVSTQYVNKLLQGKQNLTLKTIANLSEELGFELISFPSYKDSYVLLYKEQIPSSTVKMKDYAKTGTEIQDKVFAVFSGGANNLTKQG